MRLVPAQECPGTRASRYRTNLDAWVSRQQAEQLSARIAGRSGDRDPYRHLHDYAANHILMQADPSLYRLF